MPPGWKRPQPDPDPGDVTVEVDVDPLHEWRMRMLVQAGFDEFTAFRLSVSGADWHDCKRLLQDGCDPNLILRILGND